MFEIKSNGNSKIITPHIKPSDHTIDGKFRSCLQSKKNKIFFTD